MDRGLDGARFENNIGFRNGGSCFCIARSSNDVFINNTRLASSQYNPCGLAAGPGSATGGSAFFGLAMSRAGVRVRRRR
jgi:hypothetical protein